MKFKIILPNIKFINVKLNPIGFGKMRFNIKSDNNKNIITTERNILDDNFLNKNKNGKKTIKVILTCSQVIVENKAS